ncbi:hypothetical protein DMC64_42465, partial [Amycolatopsis sp. WAC 04197]|uniref:hypothetical protein n=1 Tax=Amycolatopsis sp. WAC 04197 TaxID=2203199 RepID=UPI00100382D9
RRLNADTPTDHEFISKLAYAAAWENKTATPDDITETLQREGITGTENTLLRLVTEATDEATRNGDRLTTLTTTDPDHHHAIHTRASTILDTTPALHDPHLNNPVGELVKHLRMRHITGPQQDLETLARNLLTTPGPDLTADFSLDPIELSGVKTGLTESGPVGSGGVPGSMATLAAVSQDIIRRHGDLEVRHLINYIPHDLFPAKRFHAEIKKNIGQERRKLDLDGELWKPIYAGTHRKETFSEKVPNDLTVWLYRRVVAKQTDASMTIARSAQEAGFAVGYNELLADIKQAMAAAEKDGRRHPELSMTKPGHRPQIEELTDRILANNSDRTLKDTIADLNALNVHGRRTQFKDLVDARKQALKDDPELLAAARTHGLPELSPTGEFLERRLNADTPTDHDFISKLAYAAAWENKTATPDDITETLQREGITGTENTLLRLVTEATDEATRNGDRLTTLTTTDPDHHHAIHTRASTILDTTPALHDPHLNNPVGELVKHLRMRHITGPQQDLETLARNLLTTPGPDLTADFSLDPIELREGLLDPGDPRDLPAIVELASTVVEQQGNLAPRTLEVSLRRQRVKTSEGVDALIAQALEAVQAAGSLWSPRYRAMNGQERQARAFDPDGPDDLTALLWQLAVDHRREDAEQLARRAEYAGFAGPAELRSKAQDVIRAAERQQRRHPYLSTSVPESEHQVSSLIAAVITDAMSADVPDIRIRVLIERLRGYNVRGSTNALTALVSEGITDAAVARSLIQDPTRLQFITETARQLLALRTEGNLLGRSLDVAKADDRAWIDKIAYAAAWADKTATVEQLVARLTRDGITDSDGGLTPLVTRVVEEATRNGDRHPAISADRVANRTAILQRTGALLLEHTELGMPDAITPLVRQMRINHITGAQDKLRELAMAALRSHADQVAPGAPVASVAPSLTLVRGVPLPHDGGMAFVKPGYATNVAAAFPYPEPGVITLLAHHGSTDTYQLPNLFTDADAVSHSPHELVETIATLPVTWDKTRNHTLTLLACRVTETQYHHLATLIRQHPTLDHLTLSVPYLDTPVYVTPDGHITTIDPGVPGTLELAPKHRRDGTTVTAGSEDPRLKAQLAETAKEILQQHGDLINRYLLTSKLRGDLGSQKFESKLGTQLSATRESLKNSGDLWAPHYRGERKLATFNSESPDHYTAWLYRRVVDQPKLEAQAIARSVAEAGFTVIHERAMADVRIAMSAAVKDGRRHEELSYSKAEHREMITDLAGRILANDDRRRTRDVLRDLKELNVHGNSQFLRNLVDATTVRLTEDSQYRAEMQALGPPPALRPSGHFLDRTLSTDIETDRDFISKLAYAAAWENKAADIKTLAELLQREGVTGSFDALVDLVSQAADEATRNGDRLLPLQAGLPDDDAAVRSRTQAILDSTHTLYDPFLTPNQVQQLVKHMRIRHITGRQAVLETYARTLLETPYNNLQTDLTLASLTFPNSNLDPKNPNHLPAIRTLARNTVDQQGDLDLDTLIFHLSREGKFGRVSLYRVVTEAKRAAYSDESSWHPRYRGQGRERAVQNYDLGVANDFTALLWRLVVDHPRQVAQEIARQAEHAGFYRHGATRASVDKAISAAERLKRRHPFVDISDPEARPRVRAMTAALLADNPGYNEGKLATLLRHHNVHGANETFTRELRSILAEGRSDADVSAGRALLGLVTEGNLLGRSLDVADAGDRAWIDKLAYAAAWADKTAT